MNWNSFLPAAVRDIHAKPSVVDDDDDDDDGSTSSNSSYGQNYIRASRVNGDDDMTASQGSDEESSFDYRSYDETEQYSVSVADGESVDEDFSIFLGKSGKHRTYRNVSCYGSQDIVLHKAEVKGRSTAAVVDDRNSFLHNLLSFGSSPPTKKKFHRHCIPKGLPPAPSMVEEESEMYDLPRPPSLIYEYRVIYNIK